MFFFNSVKHLSQCSDSWYQSFYSKRKKGKNKGWNAKAIECIDKNKEKKK